MYGIISISLGILVLNYWSFQLKNSIGNEVTIYSILALLKFSLPVWARPLPSPSRHIHKVIQVKRIHGF